MKLNLSLYLLYAQEKLASYMTKGEAMLCFPDARGECSSAHKGHFLKELPQKHLLARCH